MRVEKTVERNGVRITLTLQSGDLATNTIMQAKQEAGTLAEAMEDAANVVAGHLSGHRVNVAVRE